MDNSNNPKLSIFSVVKNEEQMITDCLESIRGADEIVVIDTGSTDKTIEIAKKYTDKVYTDYKWNDNFAEAKNYALSKCTGDFVMSLDADCRLEKGGIAKMRKATLRTDKDVISIRVVPEDIKNKEIRYHYLPKIFRKTADIHYVGKVHEYIARKDGKQFTQEQSDISIVYLYSPNHRKDPDRNLRILLQEVKDNPKSPRWKFYLGREYFDHKEYIKSIWWFNEYLKIATWQPEISEAYLMIAKCYWWLNMGDDARMMCMHAIRINPDCEESLRFMSEMNYEPRKSKWLEFSKLATNKNVLFIRGKK